MTSVVGTASDTTGSSGWTNPSNAYTDNAAFAVSGSVANLAYTTRLQLLGWGFAIPSGATIDGVSVSIKAKNALSGTGFQVLASGSNGAELWLSGAILSGTTQKGTSSWAGTSEITRVAGGSADLWGASSISPSDINNADFGVRFNARNGNASAQAFSVNHVFITVYYTYSGANFSSQQLFMCEG